MSRIAITGLLLNNIRDFGAVGDGVTDDRAEIQAAVDDAVLNGIDGIFIPSGVFAVTRLAATLASIDLLGVTNFSIVGAGAGSQIKMIGDGGSGNWFMFRLRSLTSKILFRDLLLDGNKAALTNADVQTHLIQIGSGVGGGVTDVDIDNVTLFQPFGDGVRMLGTSGVPGDITRVSIRNCRFVDSGLDAIGFQRGVSFVQIRGNHFQGTVSNDIDIAPTGVASPTDIIIEGNTCDHPAPEAFAFRFVGISITDLSSNINFVDNIVRNGNLFLFNVLRTLTQNNNILGFSTSLATVPIIAYASLIDESSFIGNTVERPATAAGGDVVRALHQVLATPKKLLIEGNTLIQNTNGNVVRGESCEDISILGNYLDWRGTAVGTIPAVVLRATIAVIRRVQVNDNIIKGTGGGGSMSSGVLFSTSTMDIEFIAVQDNAIQGASNGVRFELGGGVYTRIPIVSGNEYDVTTADISLLANVTAVTIAGGPGATAIGAAVFMRAGSPVGVFDAPIGSLCINRLGAVGTALFLKQAATSAGWAPIGSDAAVLAFGNNSVAAAADTRFLDQWNSTTTAGTVATTPIVAPRAGRLRNMFVHHAAAVGNGNSIVYTVLINGVASTLTVTLATGAIATASDLVNTVLVAQGDLITLRAVKALALGNGAVIPSVTMELG